MKASIWLFMGMFTATVANATIEIGYLTDNQILEVSGPSGYLNTDSLRVGYKGNANKVSVLNGAKVSVSNGCVIGHTSWDSYWGDRIPAHNNIIEVSGADSRLDSRGMSVGFGPSSRNNQLLISNGGSVSSSGGAHIGVYAGGGNIVEVTGTGSEWEITGSSMGRSALTVGYRSSGNSMVVSNGATVASTSAVVGYWDSIYSTDNNKVLVTGAGSTWNSGSLQIAPRAGSGNVVEVSDGGKLLSSCISISAFMGGANNGIKVSGAGSTVIAGSVNMDYAYQATSGHFITIESGGEMITTTLTLNNYYTDGWSGIKLSNLNLNDGGTLTVRGNLNASQLGFNYNLGSTLSVEGQLSGLSTLESGRRLETPNVLGDMTVHGVFAPGNSPADSLMNGALTLAADGTLEMELAGYALGTEYDRLTVTGLSLLDGTLDIVLLDDFSVAYGDSFDLFNWDGGVSGEFESISTSALSGGLYWDTSSLYTSGTLVVIPEPASLGLILLVCGCELFVRRVFMI